MFNQCNIFLFTRKKRTPAAITVAVLNFYTIGAHLQRHKKWYEWRWNLQIKHKCQWIWDVLVNQGADEAPATIITVHLPVPAASLPPSGPRSRRSRLKTIFTCIQTNNRNKYNKTKLKRKWENEKSSIEIIFVNHDPHKVKKIWNRVIWDRHEIQM